MGSFNNWNIIKCSHKATISEAFEEIHQVVLDGISDNMSSLVKYGKYCYMNTKDTTISGYYVIKTSWKPTLYRNTQHVKGKILQLVN